MRAFVISTFALALALAPAAAFAQAPTTTRAAAGRAAASGGRGTAAPATPAAPKVAFTTPAGLLLVQVKPDQTAAFEEMMDKIQKGVVSADPTIKAQAGAGITTRPPSRPPATSCTSCS